MGQETSPTFNRRQLGAELRRLRLGVGLGIERTAEALNCSQTRVSRIETGKGRATLRVEEIHKLCRLYGVHDRRHVDILLDMLTSSQRKGWWESFEDVLPSGLDVLVGLEGDARAELAWEPLLVHGLLQTPQYAREVLRTWPSNRPHDLDDLVRLRMERQRVLTRTPMPLELWAVLDEAAIRRPVGGPDVMRDQLAHIAEVSCHANVTIQVLPMRKGATPGLIGAFSLLEFDDQTVAYVDSPAGNLYLDKRPDIRRFETNFNMLRALALDPKETHTLLSSTSEEMQ